MPTAVFMDGVHFKIEGASLGFLRKTTFEVPCLWFLSGLCFHLITPLNASEKGQTYKYHVDGNISSVEMYVLCPEDF